MKGNAILLLIGGISLMMVFALTYPSIIAAPSTIYSTSYYTDFTLSNIEHDVSDNCTFWANVTYNHGGQNASYVVAGNAFNATIGAQNDWIWNIRSGVDYPTLAMEYAGFPRGSIPVGAVEISNVTELQNMSSDLSANYVLMNDIDASATSGWNGGAGFAPIGDDFTTPFTGTFDGRGYEISNLYINRSATDYVGLFGHVGVGGEVRNVGMIDVDVSGRNLVGGFVGRNLGTVSNSFVTGIVEGNDNVGGIVGRNVLGTTTMCYSIVNMYGNINVGGVAGYNSATINNSYATGTVNRISGAWVVFGGFVGQNYRGKIINCYSTGSVHYEGVADPTNKGFAGSVDTGGDYEMTGNYWNTETSGQSSTAGDATGKTTAEMRDIDTYTTWDIVEVDEYTVPVISVSITIDYTVDGRVCTITFTDTVHNNTATYIVITVTYHDEYLSLILQLALAGIVVIGVVYAAMEVLT